MARIPLTRPVQYNSKRLVWQWNTKRWPKGGVWYLYHSTVRIRYVAPIIENKTTTSSGRKGGKDEVHELPLRIIGSHRSGAREQEVLNNDNNKKSTERSWSSLWGLNPQALKGRNFSLLPMGSLSPGQWEVHPNPQAMWGRNPLQGSDHK